MRHPAGFGSTALVALCVFEVVSLVTIAVAAATAPLVPATGDSTHAERPDRAKRYQRSVDSPVAEPQRLAQ